MTESHFNVNDCPCSVREIVMWLEHLMYIDPGMSSVFSYT